MGALRPLRRGAALSLLLLPTALLLLLLAYRLPRIAYFDFDQPPRSFEFAGFSGREQFADGRPFRWSRPQALITIPNPGRGPLLWQAVLAAGPRGTVPLTVTAGGSRLAPFVVQAEPRVYHFLALQRQRGQQVALELSAPLARDTNADRKIGVAVGPLRLGVGLLYPPPLLVAALALAGIGAFALLLQAGTAPLAALATVLAIQGLFAVADSLWLWRWGISIRLLGILGGGALLAVLVERWLVPSGKQHPSVPAGWWATSGWAGILRREGLAFTTLLLVIVLSRLPLISLSDPTGDINAAVDRIALLMSKGFAQAYRGGNDYLALRHYMLLGLGTLGTLLGISITMPLSFGAAVLFKGPQLVADALSIMVIYGVARRWRSAWGAFAVAALYALTPPVWINAAWWGQVDSILILGMLLALVLIERSAIWAWLAWALAVQVKPQPIMLLPVLGVATVSLQRAGGVLRGGLTALVAVVLGALPLVLAGQTGGLLQAYEESVGRFPYTSVSAYNLWSLLHGVRLVRDEAPLLFGLSSLQVGLGLLAVVVMLTCLGLLQRADLTARLEAGALLALAFFVLTTQMHQRYIVFVFPLLALRVASAPYLAASYLLLALSGTLNIFGTLPPLPLLQQAISTSSLPTLAALINLSVLLFLLGHFLLLTRRKEESPP